jgi:hypothetical protein
MQMGYPISIAHVKFSTLYERHYTPAYFNDKIASQIIGAGDVDWSQANAQQSCAIRMSIALAYAGIPWKPNWRNSWRLQGKDVYFPSLASDYPKHLLAGGRLLAQAERPGDHKGILYFGGAFPSASGHLTVWDGVRCHFDDDYWDQPKIYFWKIAE